MRAQVSVRGEGSLACPGVTVKPTQQSHPVELGVTREGRGQFRGAEVQEGLQGSGGGFKGAEGVGGSYRAH